MGSTNPPYLPPEEVIGDDDYWEDFVSENNDDDEDGFDIEEFGSLYLRGDLILADRIHRYFAIGEIWREQNRRVRILAGSSRVYRVSEIGESTWNDWSGQLFTRDQLLDFLGCYPSGLGMGGMNIRAGLIIDQDESTQDSSSVVETAGTSKTAANSFDTDSLLHTHTYWSQTETEVGLKVEICDVKEYKLSIDKNIVYFESLRPAGYGFSCKLFDEVDNPEVFTFGLYTRIILKKKVQRNWPKILEPGTVMPKWLKEEVETKTDSENDEEWLGFGSK